MNLVALRRRIDDFAFDRIFQPIVNRFPDAGPASVARFFLTGNLVFYAADEATTSPHDYLLFGLCVALLMWLYYITGNPRVGMRNPDRIRTGHRLARMMSLAFLTFDAVSAVMSWCPLSGLAESVLLTSFWYSSACDKLPPLRTENVWERRRVGGVSSAQWMH